MKRQYKGKKFSRERGQRKALLKSLVFAVFRYNKIKTTEAKAKETARFVDKAITTAKKGTIFSRRTLAKSFDQKTVKKIVDEIAPKYKERKGGYSRIVKLGQRKSDGARMAIIELI